MARATPETPSRPSGIAGATTFRRFEAPREFPAEAHVQSIAEEHIEGYVEPDNVRALLDAFGLEERKNLVFPFQHLKRQHGEIWRLRIEEASHQVVDGKTMLVHHWLFVQDVPERVGAAN